MRPTKMGVQSTAYGWFNDLFTLIGKAETTAFSADFHFVHLTGRKIPALPRYVTKPAQTLRTQSLLRALRPFASGPLLPVGTCAAMAELVDAQR